MLLSTRWECEITRQESFIVKPEYANSLANYYQIKIDQCVYKESDLPPHPSCWCLSDSLSVSFQNCTSHLIFSVCKTDLKQTKNTKIYNYLIIIWQRYLFKSFQVFVSSNFLTQRNQLFYINFKSRKLIKLLLMLTHCIFI